MEVGVVLLSAQPLPLWIADQVRNDVGRRGRPRLLLECRGWFMSVMVKSCVFALFRLVYGPINLNV